jgi:hypothetical protein
MIWVKIHTIRNIHVTKAIPAQGWAPRTAQHFHCGQPLADLLWSLTQILKSQCPSLFAKQPHNIETFQKFCRETFEKFFFILKRDFWELVAVDKFDDIKFLVQPVALGLSAKQKSRKSAPQHTYYIKSLHRVLMSLSRSACHKKKISKISALAYLLYQVPA